MARIRTIKPELFRHEELYDLEIETGLPMRLAWMGLFTCCDREGRFKWRARQLKSEILPYDDVDFSRVLDAWGTRGFVVKYRVDSEDYGYIPTWNSHQVINNREQESALPAPEQTFVIQPVDACPTRAPREVHVMTTRSQSCKEEGKGKEGKGITPPNPLKEGEPENHNPVKRKRRTRTEVLAPYLPEVGEIVNGLAARWPAKQPGDGKPIEVDIPKLAERIDTLLRDDGVTRILIEQSADLYLGETKRFYKHPQFFFGIGNGESAHWATYAKMVLHRQAKEAGQ